MEVWDIALVYYQVLKTLENKKEMHGSQLINCLVTPGRGYM